MFKKIINSLAKKVKISVLSRSLKHNHKIIPELASSIGRMHSDIEKQKAFSIVIPALFKAFDSVTAMRIAMELETSDSRIKNYLEKAFGEKKADSFLKNSIKFKQLYK